MRCQALFAVITVFACAPSGTVVATGAVPQSIGVAGSGDRLTIAPGSGPHLNTLDVAPDRVWRVLPAAFDSVGVPVGRLDQGNKIIANDGLKIRQRLGKVLLSRYIDCGQTQIGPNADSYEVYLILAVQVRAAGPSSSSLSTTFEANARPIAFSQGYSRCTTNGALEAKLLGAVKALLSTP
ncbi:MAG: hypothetical protein P3A28_01870 [Gemmatimonadota bacterium]|nr:hypothetical protein [Gemmatimonadota bacterium]